MAVGDYENDLPMLDAADVSYAVAGGSPLAAAHATRMTVPVGDGAIAAVIRDIEDSLT